MWILSIQLLDEMLHKQCHHRLVGVGLGDTQINIASLVNSGDHADPRLDLLALDGVIGTIWSPVHPSEV